MKIIKTAQFEHTHHGDDNDALSFPDVDVHALGHDLPPTDDVGGDDLDLDGAGGDPLAELPGLDALDPTIDDQGDLSMDIGLDGPMEPGVGPDLGDVDLGDNGTLDVEMHIDPDPAADQLPLDLEVEGHEVPVDGLLEDHNDPSLGLHEIEGNPEDEFPDFSPSHNPHPHDGIEVGNDDEDVDLGGEGAGHGHHEAHDPDAGIDGLLVIDDGAGDLGAHGL